MTIPQKCKQPSPAQHIDFFCQHLAGRGQIVGIHHPVIQREEGFCTLSLDNYRQTLQQIKQVKALQPECPKGKCNLQCCNCLHIYMRMPFISSFLLFTNTAIPQGCHKIFIGLLLTYSTQDTMHKSPKLFSFYFAIQRKIEKDI